MGGWEFFVPLSWARTPPSYSFLSSWSRPPVISLNSRRYATLSGRAAPHTLIARLVKAVVLQTGGASGEGVGHIAAVIWDAKPSWAYPS